MSRAGRERSHRVTCGRKLRFASKMLADNFATLVSWSVPDDPRCQGMEGYLCTSCTEYHVGHPRVPVIPFGYDTGRVPSGEADSDASADTADALGRGDLGWVTSEADAVQEVTGW